MSITQSKENIVSLLENIIKRSELMEKQSGSRNLLEIDLAMEDIRLLYREFDALRKLTENENTGSIPAYQRQAASQERSATTQPRPEPVKEPRPETPIQQDVAQQPEDKTPTAPVQEQTSPPEPLKEQEPPKVVEQKPEPAAIEMSSPRLHTHAAPKQEIAEQPQALPNSPAEAHKTAKPVQSSENGYKATTLVGEKFSGNKNSVHERLAQIKEDKSIGAHMQRKSVSNIKEAIGINEKFLFINELFNGDLKSYNEAIERLNSVPSIHEAFEFLNQLTSDFNWDGQRSAETIERFANLVQRRHMNS